MDFFSLSHVRDKTKNKFIDFTIELKSNHFPNLNKLDLL